MSNHEVKNQAVTEIPPTEGEQKLRNEIRKRVSYFNFLRFIWKQLQQKLGFE